MPSGALNEFDCTADAARSQHPTPYQQADCCQDCRPLSPGSASSEPCQITVTPPSDEETVKQQAQNKPMSTRKELAKIRDGFDAWLAAFRQSRPTRDVIWRVGTFRFFSGETCVRIFTVNFAKPASCQPVYK